MINCIDVSSYNIVRAKDGQGDIIRDIDWKKVCRQPFSPKIVYIKLGEGCWNGYRLDDPLRWYDNAGDAGIAFRMWYTYAHPNIPPATRRTTLKPAPELAWATLPLVRDTR